MASSEPPMLQHFPWQDSIWAVKSAIDFHSYDEFSEYLRHNLRLNSPESRKKYTTLITHRYFSDHSLSNLLVEVWRHYRDEGVLADVMRVATLESEPVIARFVVEELLPRPPGTILDPDVPRAFIERSFGEFKEKSYTRLMSTARHLGFVGRYNRQVLVEAIATPGDAMLILLHDRLAETPRIVRVTEILEANWWRYLGLRSADAVRDILRAGESAGLLARYAIVDELEQVTTRFSRDRYIEKALLL